MACRGIRGATTVPENTPDAIRDATQELLRAMVRANDLCPADIASVLFTVTADLDAIFPAQAVRELGWDGVALLDTAEAPVPGSLPSCIRVLIHWNTDRPAEAIQHVYLRDAGRLRPDRAPNGGPNQETNRAIDWGGGSAVLLSSSTSPTETPRTAARQAAHPTPSAKESKMTEDKPAQIVAYQGEPGAYSQEAIVQHFGPQVQTLACSSFDEIFGAVEGRRATLGLLPVENSQAGSVIPAYDLLLEHDLRVIGEAMLRVRHCLLAPAGTRPADIRRVYSHPQALAQCERYLKNHGWQAVTAYDTAGSARALAESGEPGAAAIASALAGQIYGLDVLERGIEDSPENTTRFFVLGTEEPPRAPRNKTSLVFSTAHTPGSLWEALGEFARRGINLNKIESRPRRNQPWHYVFYVDLDGHWQDPEVEQALVCLLARAAFVKLLGSYPVAPSPTQD